MWASPEGLVDLALTVRVEEYNWSMIFLERCLAEGRYKLCSSVKCLEIRPEHLQGQVDGCQH